MKHILYTYLLSIFTLSTVSATEPWFTSSPAIFGALQEPPPEKKDEIFEKVENMPEFPGGFQAFRKFVSDNVRLPEYVPKTDDKARIFCSLVVLKDGRISDVKVVRGVDPFLDAEAVRVLQSMPRWEPGKEHGQNVNVRVSVLVIIDMMTATRTVINGRN